MLLDLEVFVAILVNIRVLQSLTGQNRDVLQEHSIGLYHVHVV